MKSVLFFVINGLLLVSCDSGTSLQEYYVETQASTSFIRADIPSSILSLKNENTSEEVKSTLNSVKKINFLGFKKLEENSEEFMLEKAKVKEILKHSKYNELMRVDSENKSMQVKYLGQDDSIDEVIIFGSDTDLGFALIRVIGDKMDPAKMMALIKEVNVNNDSAAMGQITSFLSTMN